jgi:hypothetical protein
VIGYVAVVWKQKNADKLRAKYSKGILYDMRSVVIVVKEDC